MKIYSSSDGDRYILDLNSDEFGVIKALFLAFEDYKTDFCSFIAKILTK